MNCRSPVDPEARLTRERWQLPLNALLSYEVVARYGGFAAAARCGGSRATLQRQVVKLERFMGTLLVQRSQLMERRQHALTSAGEKLYSALAKFLHRLERGLEGKARAGVLKPSVQRRASVVGENPVTLAPRQVPLNALRAFEVVARHGGFHAAGRVVTSQSNLTYHVLKLERFMGTQLFDRARTFALEPHALTPDGEELFAVVPVSFDLLHRSVKGLRNEALPKAITKSRQRPARKTPSDAQSRAARIRRKLPLKALRAFEAVARHGGFKAAGRLEPLSQSMLTDYVLKLERFVGTPLFVRVTARQPLGLTLTGEKLFAVVSPCLDSLEDAFKGIPRAQLPLNTLGSFEAVARCGGFKAGARALRCAQPTLTRQVLELERVLGTPLFERSQLLLRKEHALTAAGEILLPAVVQCFDRLQEVLRDVRQKFA